MSSKPEERLDRRDFMIASIATIGASAALVVDAGSASAQNSATSSVSPAPRPPSGTVYTGDTIQGKKVVSALDVNDLEPGTEASFIFSGRSDADRTILVCVRDRRQGGKAGQAHRSRQRCAWRRDEFRAYGPDRDEPARSRGDVRHGDGGHRRVPPSHGRHAAQMAQFR